MKKHLSVLALCARNNLAQILSLLSVMCVLETLLFRLLWGRFRNDFPPPAADRLLGGIPFICYAALLLMAFVLCRSGESQGTAYSFRRLRIREETAILWRAVYNSICILTFWAVQTALALGLFSWYANAIDPAFSSPQTVFLAFYHTRFLHNLLPLDNWTRYLSSGFLLAALGFSTAVRTYKIRRGSRFGWGMVIFLCGMIAGYFNMEVTTWPVDAFGVLSALAAIAVDAAYLIEGGRGELREN